MQEVGLVVEPVALVAEDLALILAEVRPGLRVLKAPDADAALPIVEAERGLRVAIVHGPPEQFGDTPLGRALAQRGARVAFMGTRAEAAAGNWPVLFTPFAGPDVGHLLHSMGLAAEPTG
jgi:hypothetical protein